MVKRKMVHIAIWQNGIPELLPLWGRIVLGVGGYCGLQVQTEDPLNPPIRYECFAICQSYEGVISIEDVGNEEGVFVNGERMEYLSKIPLPNGASVLTGGYEILIQINNKEMPKGITRRRKRTPGR